MLAILCATSLTFFAGSALAACREGSETDCVLNGVCKGGVCVCDPGWQGEKCNQLKLKPPNRLEPHGYYNGSMPTWGGDVIYENGIYHLFVTAKGYTDPPLDEADHYMCNTAIVRLEGKSPAGPFTFAEVVLPVFHHETHAIRAPDGTLLIYMIKYDGGEFPDLLSEGCREKGCGVGLAAYNRSHEVMAVAWSSSVYGPWKEKIIFNPWPGPDDRESWHCQTNCPSVTFTPNGTAVMAFRSVQCQPPAPPAKGTKEKIGIATAPHWSGPYTFRTEEPVFGWTVPDDWPASLVTPGQVMSNEDPFIWRTERGYHMLTHCQLQPQSGSRGAYGYSEDGLSWTLLPDFMWETNMTWSDGSVSYFVRRQAPGLYLDNDGYPLYLLTPVDELPGDGCHWGHGWTLMQPIGR